MYALKTLRDQPLRFIITAFGVALCVVLILFLLGIYKGVADGSVEYVRSSKADLWVLQRHATNILRSTSLLTVKHGRVLERMEGVEKVSPVFFILAAVDLPEGLASLYLAGYDPASGRGGPPDLAEGRNVEADNEIVLDRSFAAKHNLGTGDTLKIRDDTLTVVGLSQGTNMFVIQYAFITLPEAYSIIGIENLVSCFQVEVNPGTGLRTLTDSIQQRMQTVVAYDRETFLQNNIHEMESGILPLLFFVAVIGAVVLTAILSLILSINVLERRKDFAVMKALGSPGGFISKLVVAQSLLLAGSGLLTGVVCFFPLMKLVERLAPEVSVLTSGFNLGVVASGVLGISLLSSVLPVRKLRKIYPMEVFK